MKIKVTKELAKQWGAAGFGGGVPEEFELTCKVSYGTVGISNCGATLCRHVSAVLQVSILPKGAQIFIKAPYPWSGDGVKEILLESIGEEGRATLKEEMTKEVNRALTPAGKGLVIFTDRADHTYNSLPLVRDVEAKYTYEVVKKYIRSGVVMVSPPWYNPHHSERLRADYNGGAPGHDVAILWFPPKGDHSSIMAPDEESAYPLLLDYTKDGIGGIGNFRAFHGLPDQYEGVMKNITNEIDSWLK